MIICHCQQIRDSDIHAAINWMRAADPAVVITPGWVYRALGKSAECGGCIGLFVQTMRENPNALVPVELCGLRMQDLKRSAKAEGEAK
jgi:bacterioferritin-associated ferredoxin